MAITKTGATFWEPIRAGDIAAIATLLRKHPDQVDAFSGIAGGTLLHYAAGHPILEVVQFLVDSGFDVNRRGELHGDLAIVDAAAASHVEIVRYLLEKGSRLDTDKPECNALFASIIAGRGKNNEREMMRAPEVAELLLRAGIDYSVQYKRENRTLVDARLKAEEWGAQTILDMIEAWDRAGRLGEPPKLPFQAEVFKALRAVDLPKIQSLFEVEPERVRASEMPGGETQFGSWLHAAAVISSSAVAKFFLDQGCDLEFAPRGWTPLYTSARNNNLAVAEYLLGAGAQVFTGEKEHPLLGAARGNAPKIAELMLLAGAGTASKKDQTRAITGAERLARGLRHEKVAEVITAWASNHR